MVIMTFQCTVHCWEISRPTFTSHFIALSSSPHIALEWDRLSHLWFTHCFRVRMKESLSGSNPYHGLLPSSPTPLRHNYPLKFLLFKPNFISTLIWAMKLAHHLQLSGVGQRAYVPVKSCWLQYLSWLLFDVVPSAIAARRGWKIHRMLLWS